MKITEYLESIKDKRIGILYNGVNDYYEIQSIYASNGVMPSPGTSDYKDRGCVLAWSFYSRWGEWDWKCLTMEQAKKETSEMITLKEFKKELDKSEK